MVTLFYQTAIDHVYFYEIEFAKLIIRYPSQSASKQIVDSVHNIISCVLRQLFAGVSYKRVYCLQQK